MNFNQSKNNIQEYDDDQEKISLTSNYNMENHPIENESNILGYISNGFKLFLELTCKHHMKFKILIII